MESPEDSVNWKIRVQEPGAYRLVLNYSAGASQSEQEGILCFAGTLTRRVKT